MAMTWKELGRKIQAMTADQLVSDVTIHLHSQDEYYSVDHYELTNDNEEDRLDDGDPFLVVLDEDQPTSNQRKTKMGITWDELRVKLQNTPTFRLKQLVSVRLPGSSRYANKLAYNANANVDDPNALFLAMENDDKNQRIQIYDGMSGKHQDVSFEKMSDASGIAIQLPGYGLKTMNDDCNEVMYLEYYNGKLLLRVWADINSEEPTHVINLSDAKLSNRDKEGESETAADTEAAKPCIEIFRCVDGFYANTKHDGQEVQTISAKSPQEALTHLETWLREKKPDMAEAVLGSLSADQRR